MNILRNRYLRCFLASGVAGLVAPKVNTLLNWTIPELTPIDGVLNDLEMASTIGILAGIGAIVLGAAFGVPESSSSPPAAAGSAS